MHVSIVAGIDGLEDDVCLMDVDFLLGALSGWRGTRGEAVALAEGALALALALVEVSHPRKGCVLHLRNSESLYIITTSPRRRESGLNDVLLDTLKRISCLEVV
jgi:hypothetical protein